MAKRLLQLLLGTLALALPAVADVPAPAFLQKVETFEALEKAQQLDGLWARLVFRAGQEPLLPIATVIFLLAIIHTFLAARILHLGEKIQDQHEIRAHRRAKAE